MRITQITVSYGETQSLPEYSNVKPSLTITATLDESDEAQTTEAELWMQAKNAVREQIDLALEANGKAAKWSGEPRYQVMQTYWTEWQHQGEAKPQQYVIILPNEINPDRDAYAQRLVHAGNGIGDARKVRHGQALRIAAEVMQERDYILLDCSDGDLTRLEAVLGAPGRPFDEEDARAQEITSPEYQAAMGVESEVDFDEEFEDEGDEEDE